MVEFYLLLWNPAVLQKPLSSPEAAAVCQTYRRHPCWRLVEDASVMEAVWQHASETGFPRRRTINARLALTLLHHGVRELATANTRDFVALRFKRVWNPVLA